MEKMFAYTRMANEIDTINEVEMLKNVAKSYVKLYFKQQEVIGKLNLESINS
jgi:hypothetical protein